MSDLQIFSVRAEPVEAPFSIFDPAAEKVLPFDRLRANGGSVEEMLA